MSGKVGRPTKAAIAARERRRKERHKKARVAAEKADQALSAAAVHAVARRNEPDAVHAHGLLQKAAHAYVRANEEAWRDF